MAKLGPYELNSIVTGDARELAKAIPDQSIDLIFTDPVYDRIEDYAWLAETAARVLKDDRACLVWIGIGYLPETLTALSESLNYRWRFLVRPVAMREFHGKLCVSTQEMIWLEKGKSKLFQSVLDLQFSYFNRKGIYAVNGKNWGKGDDVILRYINAFARPDDIILDPFTGGGTVPAVCKQLNRRYLAFEIDPATADLARQRVANTQPPLPLVYPEQLPLIAEAKE